MSLPILAFLVIVGIAAMVAAVHLTGGTRDAAIADKAQARGLFLLDHPNERPGEAFLTADGKAAFLVLSDGRTGIVQGIGDGFLTRIVGATDVKKLAMPAPGTLILRFADFTWRGGRYRFEGPQAADALAARLSVLNSER